MQDRGCGGTPYCFLPWPCTETLWLLEMRQGEAARVCIFPDSFSVRGAAWGFRGPRTSVPWGLSVPAPEGWDSAISAFPVQPRVPQPLQPVLVPRETLPLGAGGCSELLWVHRQP